MTTKEKTYNDLAIQSGFLKENREVLTYVYHKYFPPMAQYVLNHGGTREAAQDNFQETMQVMYLNIRDGSYQNHFKFEAYFWTVFRNLWMAQIKKRRSEPVNNVEDLETLEEIGEDTESERIKVEQFNLLEHHLQKMTPECQYILKNSYKKGSLKEINVKFGWTYEYARKKKCKCKEKLLQSLRNDPRNQYI